MEAEEYGRNLENIGRGCGGRINSGDKNRGGKGKQERRKGDGEIGKKRREDGMSALEAGSNGKVKKKKMKQETQRKGGREGEKKRGEHCWHPSK